MDINKANPNDKKYKNYVRKNGLMFITNNQLKVLITIDDNAWHMSVSHETRYPTHDELKELRYRYIPDKVTMAQLFPPKSEYVNVHKNCFHLWQIKGEEA